MLRKRPCGWDGSSESDMSKEVWGGGRGSAEQGRDIGGLS